MAGIERVLVFGGMGQVGQAVTRQFPDGVAHPVGRDEADLTSVTGIDAALDAYSPQVVVNTAVFQPVDLCETEVRRAFAVNSMGPGWLAAACQRRGVRMIHVSTDYVFSGSQRSPFSEDDCPMPCNVYARSKLAGEHLVLSADPKHCVVRTSSVYGRALPGRGTAPFVERMLERAVGGEPTRVVDDQVVSPTYAEDLGAGLWALAGSNAAGLFHMAGSAAASWYDIAERVFAFAGRLDLLSRTTAAEFGAAAPRPDYTALRSVRLHDAGIEPLAAVQEALPRHLRSAHPELVGAQTKPAAGDM